MKTFQVYGERVKACNKDCADLYRQDKRLGCFYGQFQLASGQVVGWAEGSRKAGFCVYCGPVVSEGITITPISSTQPLTAYGMGTLTQFIAKHGITMTAEPTDRNPNMPDSDHMDHWRCTLKQGGKRMSLVFSMGQAHRGKKPEPEEVLNCLASDYTENTFEEWCADYGYETDSRKAWRTYNACMKQSSKLRDFFGEEWLKELFTTERL